MPHSDVNNAIDLTHIETWVFDLDNTLYPAEVNLFAQVDRRMGEFIARELDLSYDQARIVQKTYYRDHGTTLTGLIKHHGIAPEAFLDYVHDIDVSMIKPSAELDRTLGQLPGRNIVFTNGSLAHAERVIGALDIGHHFEEIYDITVGDFVPKHEPETFSRFVERAAFEPGSAVMFDDIAKNLLPAHTLGMTTVWIRTETDWGAPRDPHAPTMDDHSHVDFEGPNLLEVLRRIRHAG